DVTGEGLALGVAQRDALGRGDRHARGGRVDHEGADEVADVALGVVGRGDRQAHGRLAAAGDVAAVDGLEDGGVVGRDVVGGDVPAAVRPGQLEAVAVVPDGGLDGEGPVGLAAGEGVVLGLVAVGRVVDEDGLDGLEVRDAGGLPVDLVERTPAGAVVDVDAVAGCPP